MNTQPDSNTNQPDSERVPNTEPTAIPRPETYVLERPDSALAWQATRLSNGSLHLAFSADERLHADCLENMRQFENGERVHVHNGDGVICKASLSSYEIDGRLYHRVSYYVELETPIPGWGWNDEETNITHLDFSELKLLDYDNPRDMYANAVTKAYDYHYQGGRYRPPAPRVNPFKNLLTYKSSEPDKD